MKGTPTPEHCLCMQTYILMCTYTLFIHTYTHIHIYIANIGTYECIYPNTFTPSQLYSEVVKYVCRDAEWVESNDIA